MRSLADLRTAARRHWDRHHYHRDVVAGRSWQPLAVPLAPPGGRAALAEFATLRQAIGELAAGDGRHYRLDWVEVAHRQLGHQRLPRQAVFETEAAWLEFIGATADAAAFRATVQATLARFPALAPVLEARPQEVLEHLAVWPRLLDVSAWFIAHPRPGVYLRQIDLPGVDTKFIEAHLAPLARLLDALLPADDIDAAATGLARHGFERRYGLRYEQPLIRWRWLDRHLAGNGPDDLSAPLDQLAQPPGPVSRVFITENKTNGLAFPNAAGALVIFGLGYGVEALAELPWLAATDLWYWGDLDTHGFAALARLRRHFPQARSFLMDGNTLAAHRSLCGEEPRPITPELAWLTQAELATLAALRLDDGTALRLEQERIGYDAVCRAVAAIGSLPTGEGAD